MAEEASGGVERVTERAAGRFHEMVARRLAGEPLQYVIGHWSFRHLEVMVDRRVLIPRPETEVTVEVALAELDRIWGMSQPDAVGPPAAATGRGVLAESPTVVDLGTGSGVIALAMATERPAVTVWATDASADALHVASANLAGVGGRAAARVRLAQGPWWDALPAELAGTVALVVSNPPYVAAGEMVDLDPVVAAWEPQPALRAGDTGLEAVAEILAGAGRWLRPDGGAVVEIAPHQADAAEVLARDAGFSETAVRPDLSGRLRVLVARRR